MPGPCSGRGGASSWLCPLRPFGLGAGRFSRSLRRRVERRPGPLLFLQQVKEMGPGVVHKAVYVGGGAELFYGGVYLR